MKIATVDSKLVRKTKNTPLSLNGVMGGVYRAREELEKAEERRSRAEAGVRNARKKLAEQELILAKQMATGLVRPLRDE